MRANRIKDVEITNPAIEWNQTNCELWTTFSVHGQVTAAQAKLLTEGAGVAVSIVNKATKPPADKPKRGRKPRTPPEAPPAQPQGQPGDSTAALPAPTGGTTSSGKGPMYDLSKPKSQ